MTIFLFCPLNYLTWVKVDLLYKYLESLTAYSSFFQRPRLEWNILLYMQRNRSPRTHLWDLGPVPLLEPVLGLLVGVVLFLGVVVGEVGVGCGPLSCGSSGSGGGSCSSSCSRGGGCSCGSSAAAAAAAGWSCCSLLLWKVDSDLNITWLNLNNAAKNSGGVPKKRGGSKKRKQERERNRKVAKG